jgi:hypothetical protein
MGIDGGHSWIRGREPGISRADKVKAMMVAFDQNACHYEVVE